MPLIDHAIPMPGQQHNVRMTTNAAEHFSGGMSIPDRNWIRLRQPFLDNQGRACVTITDISGAVTRNDATGGEAKPLLRTYLANDLRNLGYNLPPVVNATTLRLRDWVELDKRVIREARQKLTAAADLEAANSIGGFNAMGRMTYETQRMSDPGEAVVDMDGRTDANTDTPTFDLVSTPLPITHSDFGYSQRELMVSRNSDTPLDMVMGEAAGRRIGESIEDQVIGNVTGVSYATQTTGYGTHTGTSTIYGYRNFTYRLTKTNFTAPGTAETTYNEVLAALQQLLNQYFSGPFMLYYSVDYFQYMNRQFSIAGGNNASETLLTMLQKIPQIAGVKMLERLTATATLIFVEMKAQTAALINGMDITTVQWEEKGGLDLRFKTMAIKVPLLRATKASRSGILHGTTA